MKHPFCMVMSWCAVTLAQAVGKIIHLVDHLEEGDCCQQVSPHPIHWRSPYKNHAYWRTGFHGHSVWCGPSACAAAINYAAPVDPGTSLHAPAGGEGTWAGVLGGGGGTVCKLLKCHQIPMTSVLSSLLHQASPLRPRKKTLSNPPQGR